MFLKNPVLIRSGVALADMLVTILSFIIASYVRNASLSLYEFGGIAYWDILVNGYLLLVIRY